MRGKGPVEVFVDVMQPRAVLALLQLGLVETLVLFNDQTGRELPGKPAISRWWAFTES